MYIKEGATDVQVTRPIKLGSYPNPVIFVVIENSC